MIVVAIIGVLAALAIYGVVKYLAAAKSAEAKQHVGAISRGAHGDLDGDGILSTFARTGQVNTTSGKLKAATALHIELEDE